MTETEQGDSDPVVQKADKPTPGVNTYATKYYISAILVPGYKVQNVEKFTGIKNLHKAL